MSEIGTIKERIGSIETQLAELKEYVHEKEHGRANADMIRDGRLTAVETDLGIVKDNTDTILAILDGGKKVCGFALKHWKTALTFGAGIMTAAGIGNPEITKFISSFFS